MSNKDVAAEAVSFIHLVTCLSQIGKFDMRGKLIPHAFESYSLYIIQLVHFCKNSFHPHISIM